MGCNKSQINPNKTEWLWDFELSSTRNNGLGWDGTALDRPDA